MAPSLCPKVADSRFCGWTNCRPNFSSTIHSLWSSRRAPPSIRPLFSLHEQFYVHNFWNMQRSHHRTHRNHGSNDQQSRRSQPRLCRIGIIPLRLSDVPSGRPEPWFPGTIHFNSSCHRIHSCRSSNHRISSNQHPLRYQKQPIERARRRLDKLF